MGDGEEKLISIEIMGQTYQIRSKQPVERALEAGKIVDEIMRNIQSSLHIVDREKAAILVALNLADRLLSLRNTHEEEKNLKEQAAIIDKVLDEALK